MRQKTQKSHWIPRRQMERIVAYWQEVRKNQKQRGNKDYAEGVDFCIYDLQAHLERQ